MRTAITLGIVAGSDVTDLIAGVETGIVEHREAFKVMAAAPPPHKYAEIQIWESGAGIAKRFRFKAPPAAATAPAPAPAPKPAPTAPPLEAEDADFDLTPKGRKRR